MTATPHNAINPTPDEILKGNPTIRSATTPPTKLNGIQIKKIAELLEKWNNRQADIDMKGMKDLIDSR